MALRILSISGLLPICELAASNSSFQLLTNFNYPHKTAEKHLSGPLFPRNQGRLTELLNVANPKFRDMWTLDKNENRAAYGELTPAEQAKFETFENAIANYGKHPKDAAHEAGDTQYKRFHGDLHQIRLSDWTRATFQVDDAHKVVKILQVGAQLGGCRDWRQADHQAY